MIKKVRSYLGNIRNQPGVVMFVMAILITIVNLMVTWNWNFYKYSKRELALQLLGESHGIVMDIMILGILMVWINTVTDDKKNKIQAIGEIDDLRHHEGDYILVRMLRNIKTLQRLKVYTIDIHGIKIPKCMFRLYQLQGSNLSSIAASEGHFQGTDLGNCILFNGDFYKGDFSNADLSNAKGDHANFANCYFINTKMENATFMEATFSGAKINNVSFKGCNLSNTCFDSASLYRVNFKGASGIKPNQFDLVKYFIECEFDEDIVSELVKQGVPKNKEPFLSSLQREGS